MGNSSKSTKHVFTGGMNKDLDKSLLKNDMYTHAENVRLTSSEGQISNSLETVKSNYLYSSAIPSGYTIIGHCNIRDEVVIFATSVSQDRIYKFTTGSSPTETLMFYGDFGFSTSYLIKAVGRYESASVQKVYWVDGLNSIRFAKLRSTSLSVATSSYFDIIPDASMESPIFYEIGSGSLEVGMYQYAYQLLNYSLGSESLYSAASKLSHITSSNENSTYAKYLGAELNTESGKSITIEVSNIDTSNFDYIRVVSLFYNTYTSVPEINVITERSISGSTMYFVDTGAAYQGTVDNEEYSILSTSDFAARDIANKNNYLFASNITETYLDLDALTNGIYDTRIYRFTAVGASPSRESKIYDEDGVLEATIDGTSPVYPNTTDALEFDCINKFNDLSNDGTAAYEYKYQANGTTLGGTGTNISYKFGCHSVPIAIPSGGSSYSISSQSGSYTLDADDTTYSIRYYPDYSSPSMDGFKGYQRDEIYRFGFEFLDLKGRPYFVKWSGDIRTPRASDITDEITYYQDQTLAGADANPKYTFAPYFNKRFNSDLGSIAWYYEVHINILYIDFTLDIDADLASFISGFRVVRVQRESNDRTIRAQGILNATSVHFKVPVKPKTLLKATVSPVTTEDYINGTYIDIPLGQTDAAELDTEVVSLVSPEISFNKNLSYVSGDYVEYLGEASFSTSGGGDNRHKASQMIGATFNASQMIRNIDEGYLLEVTERGGEFTVAGEYTTENTISIDGKSYMHYGEGANADPEDDKYMLAGTAFVFHLTSEINSGSITSSSSRWLVVNYKRNVSNQYGGNSFDERSANVYIPCSNFIAVSGASTPQTEIFGGDTFISYFDNMFRMNDVNAPGGYPAAIDYSSSVGVSFPVETSINLNLRHDRCLTKGVDSTYSTYLQESAAKGVIDYGDRYPANATDLYLYNTVYSKEDNLIEYYPKPSSFSSTVTADARIIYSDKKIYEENSDSWLKFRTANFIDLDSTYGYISNLEIFKNKLLFWQERAFGTLSVEERSLISDADNASLVLGTGDVLDRYDYISTTVGNAALNGLVKSTSSVYWYDNNTRTIYSFDLSSKEKPISTFGGVKSYLTSNTDIDAGVIGYYDNEFSEIVFTFDNAVTDYTIAYNELIGKFVSFYSFTPTYYITTNNNKVLSVNSSKDLYRHNYHATASIRGNFYGVYYDSVLTFIHNDIFDAVKTYDSLNWYTNSSAEYRAYPPTETDNSIYLDTLDTLWVYNDNQNSTEITLVEGTNIYKNGTMWMVPFPRNAVTSNATSNVDIFDVSNLDVTKSYKERIRDKYCNIYVTYDNSSTCKFNISNIIVNYRLMTGH